MAPSVPAGSVYMVGGPGIQPEPGSRRSGREARDPCPVAVTHPQAHGGQVRAACVRRR